MADENSIPCVELPKVSIPNLTLLGGTEINGFLDFSQGAPTDCKLTFNLMLQLAPLLASMASLLKVLDVIGKLKNLVEAVPTLNAVKIGNAVPDLVTAIEKLSDYIPGSPKFQIDIVLMIKGMLSLIINFLNCFISQLESIIKFQVSIDLTAAEGNPVLLDTLLCAQTNAKISLDNLMLSLQPVQPLLTMVTVVASIAGQSITLPKLSDISATQDQAQIIMTLKQSIETIKQVVDSIPG